MDHFNRLLEETFGKKSPLKKSSGGMHDYLGMALDFSTPGMLKVLIVDYVKSILADVPPKLKARKAAAPAANHLLDVREDERVMSQTKLRKPRPRPIIV
jgi:hypothetical protein